MLPANYAAASVRASNHVIALGTLPPPIKTRQRFQLCIMNTIFSILIRKQPPVIVAR